MTTRIYLLTFLIGLASVSVVSSFETSPGYMDADYYYAGGLQLVTGEGFSEQFLWNFLDDPEALPHPSHSYWMPLTSILAALGMWLRDSLNFSAAQLGFIILAGFLPPLTASIAYSFTERKGASILAAFLAIFPAFYTPFLSTTDTFILNMVFGGLFFVIVGIVIKNKTGSSRQVSLSYLFLGILAGFMHLARTDGVLWLFISLIIVYLQKLRWDIYLLVIVGYLMVMTPWMIRNLYTFGVPLTPGSLRVLWITKYDDLFTYPGSLLTINRWINTGLKEIVEARVWALGINLQRTLAEQGEIFLFPLIILGLWHKRSDIRVRIGLIAWGSIFILMTIVFPYPGARGGLFHSAAALQPLFWSLVPVGLKVFIDWGSRIRGWNPVQAWRVFSTGLVGLALILSYFISRQRVIGQDLSNPVWGSRSEKYFRLDNMMKDLGASTNDVVMVGNPPGYYATTQRSAIAVPEGNLDTLLTAAKKFHVRFVLLEYDHPRGLNQLYEQPKDFPGLTYVTTEEDTRIYLVD